MSQRRAASYTLPAAASKPAEPVPPKPVRADRLTAFKCTEAIIQLITDQAGLSEQQAVSLFITLSSSVALKNFSEGGARNPGRLQHVQKDKLTLTAFKENLRKLYPQLAAPDVASHVALLCFYFFEIRDVDQGDIESEIADSWNKDFLAAVKCLNTALGEFVQASGSQDVFDYVIRNCSLYAEKSMAARVCQASMTADIVGVVLEAIRRDPSLTAKIPTDFLTEAVDGLTEEKTLAPIAYNTPGPVTLGSQINLLKASSTVKQSVQSDFTTLPLIFDAQDRPTDESLSRLEHFGVSSRVGKFALDGYHRYARKRATANTADGGAEDDLVELFCRDSVDPLVHQPYLLAALADAIHQLLGCPISKPAIAFRAGSAFRGECQRCINKYGLIPPGAVTLPPKANNKASKKKERGTKTQAGSDTTSQAHTDVSTTSSVNWNEEERMDDVSFKAAIVTDRALPGLALLSAHGVLSKHGHKDVCSLMSDYMDFVNVGRASNVFRANSVARGLSFNCKSNHRVFYDSIVQDLKATDTCWFHEKCNAITVGLINGNDEACKQVVDVVMRKDQRDYVKRDYRVVLLRIVASCMMQITESDVYQLSLVSTRIRVKRQPNNFRSGRGANNRGRNFRSGHRSQSRNRGDSRTRWPSNR